MKKGWRVVAVVALAVCGVFLASQPAMCQCAMCKASVEANLKESNPGIGLSINDGILFLMAMPYVLFGVIGFLWYKNIRKVSGKKSI